MTFYQETITGDLILIKTNDPTPPACPVMAQSAVRPDPWLIRLVSMLVLLIAPFVFSVAHRARPYLTSTKTRWATLVFFVSIIGSMALETCAKIYLTGVLERAMVVS